MLEEFVGKNVKVVMCGSDGDSVSHFTVQSVEGTLIFVEGASGALRAINAASSNFVEISTK